MFLKATFSSALAQDCKDHETAFLYNASLANVELVVVAISRDQRIKYYRKQEHFRMVRNWKKNTFEYVSYNAFEMRFLKLKDKFSG